MTEVTSFDRLEEGSLELQFLENGYVIVPVENLGSLESIRTLIVDAAAKFLGVSSPNDPTAFLDNVHGTVSLTQLNDLRLACINAIRSSEWFRPSYASLAYNALTSLVGNEMSMQRGIGLSVQIPKDDSSLLPVHADTWDGDSAYEVVQWVPMVDCFESKSMYIVPRDVDRELHRVMHDGRFKSAEDIFESIKDDVIYLEIPYGHVLIFSQTVAHGNRLNVEGTTRWSMNCRFKSVFSPYADKKLGEFFEPITIRPATRVGLDYSYPGTFNE